MFEFMAAKANGAVTAPARAGASQEAVIGRIREGPNNIGAWTLNFDAALLGS